MKDLNTLLSNYTYEARIKFNRERFEKRRFKNKYFILKDDLPMYVIYDNLCWDLVIKDLVL